VGRLRGRTAFKFSLFACVASISLVPCEASAQFPIPIPLPFPPHIDLRPRSRVAHPAPSHHPPSREENEGGRVEKDATEGQNAGTPADTHQEQEQASTPAHPGSSTDSPVARKNSTDSPPAFSPSR
jgi:hypothetical protein